MATPTPEQLQWSIFSGGAQRCVCVCVGERPFPFLQARSTLPCVQWASVQEQSPARARAGRPGEASTAQEEQRQKEGRGQCGDLVTN